MLVPPRHTSSHECTRPRRVAGGPRVRRALVRAIAVVTGSLVLGLLVIPGAAVAAKRPPKVFFGMDIGPDTRPADFDKMASAGVGSVRVLISWRAAQPSDHGPINWSLLDQKVGVVSSRGMVPVPDIIGSPSWVSSAPTKPPVRGNAKKKAWQNFLTAVVNRYKPGGTYWKSPLPISPLPVLNLSPYSRQFGAKAPAKPVSEWQIWSEPNLGKYFTPHKSAVAKYAKLVKLSHKAIKAADRKADLVLGGLTGFAKPSSWKFLQKLYHVKGFKRSFEAAAVHPYAPNMSKLRRVITRVRKVMRKAHDKRTSLWLTELGYGSKHPTKKWPLNKGAKGQAKALKKTYKLLIHKRKKWHIGRVYWFQWRDPAKGENPGLCSFCTSAGLLKYEGEPKPSYKAFVHLSHRH